MTIKHRTDLYQSSTPATRAALDVREATRGFWWFPRNRPSRICWCKFLLSLRVATS